MLKNLNLKNKHKYIKKMFLLSTVLSSLLGASLYNTSTILASDASNSSEWNSVMGVVGGQQISDSVSYTVGTSGMVTARCTANGEYSEHPTIYEDYNITCTPIYNPSLYLVFPTSQTISGNPSSSGNLSQNTAFVVYKRECDENGCWWSAINPLTVKLDMNVYDGSTAMSDMAYGGWGSDYSDGNSLNSIDSSGTINDSSGSIDNSSTSDINGNSSSITNSEGILSDTINNGSSSNNDSDYNSSDYNSSDYNSSGFDSSDSNYDAGADSSDLNGTLDDLDSYFNNNSNGFDSSATDSLSSDIFGNNFTSNTGDGSKYNSSDIINGTDDSANYNSANEEFDEYGNPINADGSSSDTIGVTYNDRFDNGLNMDVDANGRSFNDFLKMFGLGLDGVSGNFMDAMNGIGNATDNDSLSSMFRNILGGKDNSINDIVKKTMTNQDMSDVAKRLLLESGYSLEDLKAGVNYDKHSAYTEPKMAWDLNRITKLLKDKSIKLNTDIEEEKNNNTKKSMTNAATKDLAIQ